jgi:hypothetical protein
VRLTAPYIIPYVWYGVRKGIRKGAVRGQEEGQEGSGGGHLQVLLEGIVETPYIQFIVKIW